MADATVRGRFVWHDLMTPNSAGAHEFYGKVLDWKTEAWEQDRAYLMFEGSILKAGTAEELAADEMVRNVYLGKHFELKKKVIEF